MRPAIKLAKNGIIVSKELSKTLQIAMPRLLKDATMGRIFANNEQLLAGENSFKKIWQNHCNEFQERN